MATQTGIEWLRALMESAEPIEPGKWTDEPPSPEAWADTIDRAQIAALGEVANRPACNHGSVKMSTEYAGMKCATCGENIDPPPWLFGASENPTPGE